MTDLPFTYDKSGPLPIPPAVLRALLVGAVEAVRPGYTSRLPGSLIEDVASTDVGALALIDSARLEVVNSLTPRTANAFLLAQLGAIYGVKPGEASNVSVFVIFSGTPGFVISKGFTVSDGNFQYVVQDGGVIGSGGDSAQLFALAAISGQWSVAPGTVTVLITSVPDDVELTVVNPAAGIPAGDPETEEEFRATVMQAGLAGTNGMINMLRTLLGRISGVQKRLISVQQEGDKYIAIVGGGDAYEVAYALFRATFGSLLVGSTLNVIGATKANPGVYTTDLNHGLIDGQTATIAGSNPSNWNGTGIVTKITDDTFSMAIDTTGYPTYIDQGVVTPNSRNIAVSVNDYPDTYVIPFVSPPQQIVDIALTWNTTAPNIVSDAAMAQAGAPALADYVNGIYAGQPMNLFELERTFQSATAGIIPSSLLTRMVFAVSINGVGVAPEAGTGIIKGDPQSYFATNSSRITITRG